MEYFGLRSHQMGVGNVYYVIGSGDTNYVNFEDNYEKTYRDGNAVIQTTVQAALDACTSNRNDYVIVSANMDLSAAITMSNNRVHLIAPSGIKPGAGHPGDWALYQESAADVITITGNRCEVAGFVLLGYEGSDVIDIGSSYDTHIHNNYFGMAAGDSDTNYGIYGLDASQFSIHHNMFTNHVPALPHTTTNEINAFIGITDGGATRGVISNNYLHTGANTVVAVGILVAGYGMFITENYLWEDIAFGAADAGTFTIGIQSGDNGLVARNIVAMAIQANALEGGATDGCIENYVSTSAGGELGYVGTTS